MNKKVLYFLVALALLGLLAAACTRSASGSPAEAAEEALPNPVSTQSQLMKDIIAGTQTAMAQPLDAEAEEGEDAETEADAEDETSTDATPAATVQATSAPLPTSTAGPPPVVTLNYNTTKCGPNVYVCIQSYTKDKNVVVQATYPWLLDDMDVTFKMGPDGVYDYSQYIVVGTAKYHPEGAGAGFDVTLNIPDSLRGTGTLVVLLQTNNAQYYGTDFFVNE